MELLNALAEKLYFLITKHCSRLERIIRESLAYVKHYNKQNSSEHIKKHKLEM